MLPLLMPLALGGLGFGAARLVQKALNHIGFGPFVLPQGVLLSGWGPRPNGTGGTQFHLAVDLQAPEGTPIYAMADGVVLTGADYDGSDYGKYVIIKHSDGYGTLYAHLSDRIVNTGQTVKAGQPIGAVGRTRDSAPGGVFTDSPAHLHLEVLTQATIHVSPRSPMRLNPMRYFDIHGVMPARNLGVSYKSGVPNGPLAVG